MTSVLLPDRLDVSTTTQIIECARQLVEDPDATVDARHVGFAHPFGVVTLGAALLRREHAALGRPAYLPPTDARASRFLAEIGFDELVGTGHPSGNRTLRIRRVSATSLDASYAHHVGLLVQRDVPNTSESVAYLVETALKEMLQNVVEHAVSPTDAIVLSRWYRKHENVRIAIADSGIGFAASLRNNPANAPILDDHMLVRRAVTVEGTTGRLAQRFGGLGLKRLLAVCTARGGSVHVTSRTVDAHFGPGNNWEKDAPQLGGTTVEIDFQPGPDDGSREDEVSEEFF